LNSSRSLQETADFLELIEACRLCSKHV